MTARLLDATDALSRVVVALAIAIASAAAYGQSTYPSKTVKLIVPYPPGGGVDVVARVIAPKLSDQLGQQVVIDNRSGAAGDIGAEFVAKSAPDGHTLLIHSSTFVMRPALATKLPFDVRRDFSPVSPVVSTAMVIGVNPDVPARTLGELIALAKGKPGALAYSTCGTASPMHLAGALLTVSAQIELTHVPYRGCAPALADVVAGQVPIAFNTVSNVIQFERGGKLRLLAVASAGRSPAYPALPTIAESGFPGYAADIWFGLFAPANTPVELVDRLNAETRRALAAPDVKEKLASQYYDVKTGSAAEFAEFVRSETEKWGKLIRDLKIQAD